MFNICSILRNNQHWLELEFLPLAHAINRKYDNNKYYFYENDSHDDTRKTIQRYFIDSEKIMNGELLFEDNNTTHHPRNESVERIEHLANCRNKLLSMRPFDQNNEWTVVIDSDMIVDSTIFDEFICSDKPANAVAIGCNGKNKTPCRHHGSCYHYYDTFALVDITGEWLYKDFICTCNHFKDEQSRESWKAKQLVPVCSAFGGMMFYKTDAINNENINYDTVTIDGRVVSEHVYFSYRLGLLGGIYIDPRLIIVNSE